MTQAQWNTCADPDKMLSWARRLPYDDASKLLYVLCHARGHIANPHTKQAATEMIDEARRVSKWMREQAGDSDAIRLAHCAVIRACIPEAP